MNTKRYASIAGRIILTAAAIPALFLMACGNPDRSFVRDASETNLFAIMSSEMAVQKSQNADVRQFAQRMIDEHTAVGNQLKAITSAPNSGLPQPETALDANHQKMMDTLSASQEFDKQYVDMQSNAHDGAIKLFSDYSKNGKNDALKRFAADTLVSLQDHAQRIASLRTALTAPAPATAPETTTTPEGAAPEGTTPPSAVTPEGAAPGATGTPEGTVTPEGGTSAPAPAAPTGPTE